ncbi:Protein mmf1, mitochondrial [Lachnellula hyalina]|uniref:Protein mmf1, mitochondrial n=1 Tax=Lachnellula hyalina TaxID=1316788 RepID=A0A8H8R285_9HELO|nr:Protein mmf1, mitochondrial [Lachnellula hyalina]TVY27167.1 Protein mmf1, mitochondrial [Lachnellula hyalina]
MGGEIKAVLSDKACAFPPGLFHHAKVYNGVVYCAGQIGADVQGKLVSEDIKEQTAKTFANLSAILEASGSALERVLKVNIYMVDKADYAGMNEVYSKLMPDPKPPRACVFVQGLPGGAKVEIECVAAEI